MYCVCVTMKTCVTVNTCVTCTGLVARFVQNGGLMVSALESGMSDLDLSAGRDHCVAFSDKTLLPPPGPPGV